VARPGRQAARAVAGVRGRVPPRWPRQRQRHEQARQGRGHFEVARLTSPAQADVEASFPGGGRTDGARGADARGGVRSFRLWVLASDDLKEKTAVFFRVFKHARTARTSCSWQRSVRVVAGTSGATHTG
jgi:hypothetical protein